jgi:outer membrane receptor protein involved in Fe transport
MKKALMILYLSCGIYIVNAQSKISGSVINSDKKPISLANVLLLNPKDSSLIKGILTKEDGTYAFEKIPAGKYLIGCSYTGYQNSFTALLQINEGQHLQLDPIELNPVNVQLKDVTVTVKKPLYEQKVDRLVINVASSITSAGSTALDVLERSPGIIVDRFNNSLSINGKSGVIVLMNGKRNYMDLSAIIQMLAGLPSSSIERIEIITTPPANYDADGDAGIINIVLKANNQYGTNGSYSVSSGYSKGEQNNGSLNINHRKGKINVFGNYSFFLSHIQQVWTNYHAVTYLGKFIENYSESNRDAKPSFHNIQAGIDYEISKKTIIGFLGSVMYRGWKMEADNNAFVSTDHQLDTILRIVNNEDHTTKNYGVNLNMQHTFKPDEKITVNLDYLDYNDDNPNRYNNSYYDNQNNFIYDERVRSSKTTPLKFWVSAIDYSKKLSKKVDVEAGVKGAVSRLNNDVLVSTLIQNNWVTDSFLSGYHIIHENIGAVYSSFTVTVDSATTLKAGLRYEYTSSNLGSLTQKNIVDRHYGNIFPSLFLLHTFNEKNSVNFSYSRRIWRPSFTDLAPWVIFYDPKTFQTGNPALQPAIMDAINASYTYKNKILTVSYGYISNPIALQPLVVEATNKLISSIANGKNNKDVNVSLSLPFTVTKWWNMQNNITGRWSEANAFYKISVRNTSKGFYANSTQTFTLPKELSLELSGYYNSKGTWGLYTFKGMGAMDCGVQKKFAKKSTLSFNIRNIFSSQTSTYSVYKPEQNLIHINKSIYGYTSYSITFAHSFGNEKVKGKRERLTGAEDEKGRVN